MDDYNTTTGIAEKQKRLRAVLSYDGIAEKEMHFHLAKVLNVSNSVAKRMLYGYHKTILMRGIRACIALNISVEWLYFGRLARLDNSKELIRMLRINMAYKGYPKEIIDKAMRFNFAFIAGMKKAVNMMNLIETKRMNYIEAVTAF